MHILFQSTNINENDFNIVTYKKGSIIFNDGDICSAVGLVLQGGVKITTVTFTENEFEINYISENSLFGNNLIFTDNSVFLGTGITIKETKIIFLSKQMLLKLFKNEQFLLNYLKLISNQTRNIQKKIKILSQNSIKDKIMFLLYDNYIHNKSKTYYIKSKESLSQLINCTRPSLSRELINLKDEGLIDYDRYKIILLN